ncbi:MAG: ferritin family protein [Nevskiales bacterium]|nr:ferritin family protein [Nevskiales bacterium]
MDNLQLFLAHAIELERDAARRYEELTEAMRTAGNAEVEAFFKQMAHFSRRHLKEAMQRGGFHMLPALAADQWQWPDGSSPEAAAWEGVDGLIDAQAAIGIALDSERRGLSYYRALAASSTDAEVRHMALVFAGEEAEHVEQLEAWQQRLLEA